MIEVGEYVRTKEGYIAKCIEIDEDGDYYKFDNYVEEQYGDTFYSLYDDELNKIIGHSKNIKDLIIIGDYINGIKVIDIFYDKTEMLVIVTADRRKIYNDEILHSIVTKEQFKSIEYRLED